MKGLWDPPFPLGRRGRAASPAFWTWRSWGSEARGVSASPQGDGVFMMPGLGENTMMGIREVGSSVWAATS